MKDSFRFHLFHFLGRVASRPTLHVPSCGDEKVKTTLRSVAITTPSWHHPSGAHHHRQIRHRRRPLTRLRRL